MNDIFLVVDAFTKDGSIQEAVIRKSAILSFVRNGNYIDGISEDCTVLFTVNPDLTVAIDITYEQFKHAFYCVSLKKDEEN